MLNGGRAHLLDAPHLTIFPGPRDRRCWCSGSIFSAMACATRRIKDEAIRTRRSPGPLRFFSELCGLCVPVARERQRARTQGGGRSDFAELGALQPGDGDVRFRFSRSDNDGNVRLAPGDIALVRRERAVAGSARSRAAATCRSLLGCRRIEHQRLGIDRKFGRRLLAARAPRQRSRRPAGGARPCSVSTSLLAFGSDAARDSASSALASAVAIVARARRVQPDTAERRVRA